MENIIEIIGLLLLLIGFIIGLGAVTVIDIHGFLGRKSLYWTKATVRSHKVTKPLIWAGMILAIIGGIIYHNINGFGLVAKWHLFIAIALLLNGYFLSFRVSPYLLKMESEKKIKILPGSWQKKITISFIISFTGWWLAVFLLAWHLIASS